MFILWVIKPSTGSTISDVAKSSFSHNSLAVMPVDGACPRNRGVGDGEDPVMATPSVLSLRRELQRARKESSDRLRLILYHLGKKITRHGHAWGTSKKQAILKNYMSFVNWRKFATGSSPIPLSFFILIWERCESNLSISEIQECASWDWKENQWLWVRPFFSFGFIKTKKEGGGG